MIERTPVVKVLVGQMMTVSTLILGVTGGLDAQGSHGLTCSFPQSVLEACSGGDTEAHS